MHVLAAAASPIWPSIVSAVAAVFSLVAIVAIAWRASSYKQLLEDIHEVIDTANARSTVAVIRAVRDLFDRRSGSRTGGRRAYDPDDED